MSNDAKESWLKFLNPDSLKLNLIRASLYLTCWEMLKESVVDQPRGFFCMGLMEGEETISPEYAAEVLALAKDPLIASALWFRKMEAISDDDIALLRKLRSHRNEVAHRLPEFLASVKAEVKLEFFKEIFFLVQKIDKWWIQEIEIPINPEYDDRQLTQEDLDGVKSMRMVFMALLIEMANGQEDSIRRYYEEIKKAFEAKK